MSQHIIILEADKYLSREMETFSKELQQDGYQVTVITYCYHNTQSIIDALPSANIVLTETTFTFYKDIPKLLELRSHLNRSIELWISSCQPEKIKKHLPSQDSEEFKIVPYDVNPLIYFAKDSKDDITFKRKIT